MSKSIKGVLSLCILIFSTITSAELEYTSRSHHGFSLKLAIYGVQLRTGN